MKKLVIALCPFVVVLVAQPCAASEVAYSFSGSLVVPTGAPPFGLPATAPVSGHFAYDTTTGGVVVGDETTYAQSRFNGFFLSFGGGAATFRADNYTVKINDDFMPGAGGTFDTMNILVNQPGFPLTSIHANGVEQPVGIGFMLLGLRFSPTLLGTTEPLPAALPPIPANPFTPIHLFGDGVFGPPDVLFSIDSLSPVTLPPPPASAPEPSSALLCLVGLTMLCGMRPRWRPTRNS